MDAVGNRLSKTDSITGATTYVYDANDRLLTETATQTTAYTYDNNGNTKTKTTGTQAILYDWNDKNRLVRVQNPNGDVIINGYNENNIRVSQTVNGAKTNFLIDPNRDYAQVLEEYTNSGVQVSYVYGHDLIEQIRGGVASIYLVDGLGSTKALTNGSGVVTDRYLYDAYGNVLSSTGTTPNKYLYTGEQFDPNLGQNYLRDRFYDPKTGRFTRSDSFEGSRGEPLTLHKYLYTHGNPINAIDPSGLSAWYDSARQGGAVNNAIGQYFIGWNPGSREYDHYGTGGEQLTIRKIVRRATGDYNHPGFSGFNQRKPDLADFDKFQLYEIKTVRDFAQGLDDLIFYLSILNSVPDMPRDWSVGNAAEFIPPPILLTDLGDIAWILPPVQGVITYDLLDLDDLSILGIVGVSIWAARQLDFKRLIEDVAQAAQLAAFGAF